MLRHLSRARWATALVTFVTVLILLLAVAPAVVAQDAPPAGDPPAAEAHGSDGLLMHIIKSAGPVFGPILLAMSTALMALSVLLFLDLRMAQSIPPEFVGTFTDTVNRGQLKEAFAVAKESPSYLAKVLSAGMGRLQYGIDDARDAAMNAVDSIRSGKEQLNNYVAVIGSLGPLVGLVGTVFGMILAFRTLGNSTKGVNAGELAGNISHALVITMLGIGLAVPGVFFNVFFRNRITRISMEVANLSDDLLTQMFHNAKKGGGAATQASNAAAAGQRTAAATAAPVGK